MISGIYTHPCNAVLAVLENICCLHQLYTQHYTYATTALAQPVMELLVQHCQSTALVRDHYCLISSHRVRSAVQADHADVLATTLVQDEKLSKLRVPAGYANL